MAQTPIVISPEWFRRPRAIQFQRTNKQVACEYSQMLWLITNIWDKEDVAERFQCNVYLIHSWYVNKIYLQQIYVLAWTVTEA